MSQLEALNWSGDVYNAFPPIPYTVDRYTLGLFRAVLADPGDDTPRGILADYYEERGGEAEAKFIRQQLERRKWFTFGFNKRAEIANPFAGKDVSLVVCPAVQGWSWTTRRGFVEAAGYRMPENFRASGPGGRQAAENEWRDRENLQNLFSSQPVRWLDMLDYFPLASGIRKDTTWAWEFGPWGDVYAHPYRLPYALQPYMPAFNNYTTLMAAVEAASRAWVALGRHLAGLPEGDFAQFPDCPAWPSSRLSLKATGPRWGTMP